MQQIIEGHTDLSESAFGKTVPLLRLNKMEPQRKSWPEPWKLFFFRKKFRILSKKYPVNKRKNGIDATVTTTVNYS